MVFLNTAHAQWSTDPTVNTPVQTSAEIDFNDIMIADGSGGAFVFYKYSTPNSNGDGNIDVLYVKRLRADGTLAWGTVSTGVVVCDAGNDRTFKGAVPDGNGGVIVTWIDFRNVGDGDIYIQRFDSNGAPQWQANGVAVTSTSNILEYDAYLVSDGAGGAIVAWSWDNRTSDIQASAQRIGANGNALWAAGGVKIINNTGFRKMASMVADGAGGAIAILLDYRKDTTGTNYNVFDDFNVSDADLYAQRLSATGSLLWGNSGAVVSNEPKNQGDRVPPFVFAREDGAGGAVVLFTDWRNDVVTDGYFDWVNGDVYSQRLNSSGVRQWTSAGVSLTNIDKLQYPVDVVRTNTGNYAVAYYDGTSSVNKVVGQLLSSSGSLLWASPVNIVGSSKSEQLRLLGDLSGNVICIYLNDLFNSTLVSIRGQKFNASGAAQWGANGLSIATNTASFPTAPRAVNAESETILVTWRDFRNTATKADIYGAKVAPNGSLTTWAGGPCISIVNGNWNSSGTWQSGILPVSTSEVIIRHTVTVTASTTAKKVTVENPNGNLRLNPGVSVTVSQ
jgi:hypothetical protein